MSLSITNYAALNTARTNLATVPQAVRDDVKALGKALRSDDLASAREAYVDLVKQAPEGSSFQPGSPFAELGKALAKGDVEAAKTSFSAMIQAKLGGATTDPVKPEAPISLAPTVSSTGGSAGGTLNAVA